MMRSKPELIRRPPVRVNLGPVRKPLLCLQERPVVGMALVAIFGPSRRHGLQLLLPDASSPPSHGSAASDGTWTCLCDETAAQMERTADDMCPFLVLPAALHDAYAQLSEGQDMPILHAPPDWLAPDAAERVLQSHHRARHDEVSE